MSSPFVAQSGWDTEGDIDVTLSPSSPTDDPPSPAVTPPPRMHRSFHDDEDVEDDDEDDIHDSRGHDTHSHGTPSTGSLAPEDVELLSEHLATVKLKAEERVFTLNSQLRDLRKRLAVSEKKNLEMQHRLYLQSPQLAPRRLDFAEEEELLNSNTRDSDVVDPDDNDDDDDVFIGTNNNYEDDESETEVLQARRQGPEGSDDPILAAWEQGNRDFAGGDFESGVRHYTIAARMLAANHAAAETRVSELESELEEINAERELFAERDKASRKELEVARQELKCVEDERDSANDALDQVQTERNEALTAAKEWQRLHDNALQEITRLQGQVEGEQTRAATSIQELEAHLASLREELDNAYSMKNDDADQLRAEVAEEVRKARDAALAEVQPEIDSLRSRLEAQEQEALDTSLQLNQLQAQSDAAEHLQAQIGALQKSLEESLAKCGDLEAESQNKEIQNNQLEAELTTLREVLAETQRASAERLNGNQEEILEEVTSLREQLAASKQIETESSAQIKLLEDQEQDLYAQIEELEKEKSDFEQQLGVKTDQLKQLLKKLKTRKQTTDDQAAEIQRLESERDELLAKYERSNEEANAYQAENEGLSAKLNDALTEIQNLKSRSDALQEHLEEVKQALEEARESHTTSEISERDVALIQDKYESKLSDLHEKLEEARSASFDADVRSNAAESAARKSNEELEFAQEELSRLQIAESSLHSRIDKLEENLESSKRAFEDLEQELQHTRDALDDSEGRVKQLEAREVELASQLMGPKSDASSMHVMTEPTNVAGQEELSDEKSPPVAALNWDDMVTGGDDSFTFGTSTNGLNATGYDSPRSSGEDSPGELFGSSRSPLCENHDQGENIFDMQIKDLETRLQETERSRSELEAELQDALSANDNIHQQLEQAQEELRTAMDDYDAMEANYEDTMEQLQVERSKVETLQMKLENAQNVVVGDITSAMLTPQQQPKPASTQFSASASPSFATPNDNSSSDAVRLFDEDPSETDNVFSEEIVESSDPFGSYKSGEDIFNDHAAGSDHAASLFANPPRSPIGASLFDEGIGGVNVPSPSKANMDGRLAEAIQANGVLQEKLNDAEAKLQQMPLLQERVQELKDQLINIQAKESIANTDREQLETRILELENQLVHSKETWSENSSSSIRSLELQLDEVKQEKEIIAASSEARVNELEENIRMLTEAESKTKSELEQQINYLQQEIKEFGRDRFASAHDTIEQLQGRLEESRSELLEVQAKLAEAEETIGSLREQVDQAQALSQELEEEIEALRQSKADEVNETIASLREQVMQLESEVARATSLIESLQDDLSSAQSDAQETSMSAELVKTQVTHLNEEVASLQTERNALQGQVEQLRGESEARRAAESRATDLQNALEAEVSKTEEQDKDLEALREELEQALNGIKIEKNRVQDLEHELEDLVGVRARLEKLNDSVEGYRSSLELAQSASSEAEQHVQVLSDELESVKKLQYDLEVEKAEIEKLLRESEEKFQDQVATVRMKSEEELQVKADELVHLAAQLRSVQQEFEDANSRVELLRKKAEALEEAETEWAHEKRTLESSAEQNSLDLQARLEEAHQQLKNLKEANADLEAKVDQARDLERVRDDIEARDRALVRLSQRTTQLVGLVKRLEQERDRAQEDAAAMYDLSVDNELEERGGGLRTRTQSPLRSLNSGKGLVKEVFGAPGVLNSASSFVNSDLDYDREINENPDSDQNNSDLDGSCNFGELYDQLDERLNAYLATNESRDRDLRIEHAALVQEVMQEVLECNSFADDALSRRRLQVESEAATEELEEALRASHQEVHALQTQLDSMTLQLQYVQDERDGNSAVISSLQLDRESLLEQLSVAKEAAQEQENVNAELMRAQLIQQQEQTEDGDMREPVSQRRLSTVDHSLATAQDSEHSTDVDSNHAHQGWNDADDLDLDGDIIQESTVVEEESNLKHFVENSETETVVEPAMLNDASESLAIALKRVADMETECEGLRQLCAQYESQAQVEVRESSDLLQEISAEVACCVSLSNQLHPMVVLESEVESKTNEEIPSEPPVENIKQHKVGTGKMAMPQEERGDEDNESSWHEVVRERDAALQRVSVLEKQLAMRKSIFGAKPSAMVSNSQLGMEGRPLSPGDDFPPSASPLSSPNRVNETLNGSGLGKSTRGLAALPPRTQQMLNGGAEGPGSIDSASQNKTIPESSLVAPWSDKWWDNEPEDLDLDSPDIDGFDMYSHQDASTRSDAPASAPSPNTGYSAVSTLNDYNSSSVASIGIGSAGVVGLGSPPTSVSSLSSPPPMPDFESSTSGDVREQDQPIAPQDFSSDSLLNKKPGASREPQGWPTTSSQPNSVRFDTDSMMQHHRPSTAPGASSPSEGKQSKDEQDANKKRKDVTEPRFLSQMFGLGRHRDLVEASMQDDNSDFDEGEAEDAAKALAQASPENDMSDPFKAAREMRSRSRTFSNLSARSFNRDGFGHSHGNYPTFEVRQEPTGIISGSESENQYNSTETALPTSMAPPISAYSISMQQPPSAGALSSPPLSPIEPNVISATSNLSAISLNGATGNGENSDLFEMPPISSLVPSSGIPLQQEPNSSYDFHGQNNMPQPLRVGHDNGGLQDQYTSPYKQDLQILASRDSTASTPVPEVEWASMLAGGNAGENAGSVEDASKDSCSDEVDVSRVTLEHVQALESMKADLEARLKEFESELCTEREARLWRERQVCVAEAELEKALVEIEELRQKLASDMSSSLNQVSGLKETVTENTSESPIPPASAFDRASLSVDTGSWRHEVQDLSVSPSQHGQVDADPSTSSNTPPDVQPWASQPPPSVQSPDLGGFYSTVSSGVVPVTMSSDVLSLQSELAQCKAELESAQEEIRRLKAQLGGGTHKMELSLKKLNDMLKSREQDFDYVTKNLALDIYTRSLNSPSTILSGAIRAPSTPKRKAPLHAQQQNATVVYTKPSGVRRTAAWVYNFLLPHILLVLTTFLISVGTPPDLMKEVIRLASNVPT